MNDKTLQSLTTIYLLLGAYFLSTHIGVPIFDFLSEIGISDIILLPASLILGLCIWGVIGLIVMKFKSAEIDEIDREEREYWENN